MRLINADALMEAFAVAVKPSNNSDFARIPTWNDAVSLAEGMPTVDAIPVDWLKKYAEEHRSSLEEFRYMFMDWRERES